MSKKKRTAKIWKNWQCQRTLTGHAAAIWDVLFIDKDYILTGRNSL
jgi:hypothetical protein